MLQTDNTIVLVVDIQSRLLPALYESENFLNHCIKWLTGAQWLNLPCVVTEQYPKGLGATVEAISKVLPNHTHTFSKTRFSAWTEDVQQMVEQYQAKNIIIIGCETHICVLQTVQDLRQAGYNVYLPQECLTSRTLDNKVNAMIQISALGGVVSNIESLLFQLLKDAKHPAFKSISKLIQ